MHAHNGRGRAVGSRHFFQRQNIGQIAGVGTAPLFRHQHAHKAQLAHLLQGLRRKNAFGVPFAGAGLDLLLRKAPRHILNQYLFFGQLHKFIPLNCCIKLRCRRPAAC